MTTKSQRRPVEEKSRAATADLPPLPRVLPWPLRYIVDGDNRDSGFCFLRGPVEAYGAVRELRRLQADHRLLGLTSLGPFPLYHEAYGFVPPGAAATDGWKRPSVTACEGWAHGFREPDRYLPPDVPRALISGSDFVDPVGVWEVGTEGGRRVPKRWDIVYSCLDNDFNEIQKNWELAKACVRRLAEVRGLRILLAGRAAAADVPRLPGVETCGVLVRRDFLQVLARARLVFFPNQLDSSPRVLTEALSLDIPVLVNQEILGGWKYINPQTGRFFVDETDVVDAALDVLSSTSYRPRAWYVENHGPQKTGARLAAFIREVAARNGGPPPDIETARFVGSL